jgi:hypothetical protein
VSGRHLRNPEPSTLMIATSRRRRRGPGFLIGALAASEGVNVPSPKAMASPLGDHCVRACLPSR